MGYFVTKISVKKSRKAEADKRTSKKKGKSFAIGGVKLRTLTTFTRQLSILQDAGLPILRSLRILENQAKPGALKNSLHRRLRRNRSGLHALRSDGQIAQGLQPALRQHDQGGRGGWCVGDHPPPPGRVPGTGRSPATQGSRRADLPDLHHPLRRRHPHVHYVVDCAEVHCHFRGLRRRPAHDDQGADRRFGPPCTTTGTSCRAFRSRSGS